MNLTIPVATLYCPSLSSLSATVLTLMLSLAYICKAGAGTEIVFLEWRCWAARAGSVAGPAPAGLSLAQSAMRRATGFSLALLGSL